MIYLILFKCYGTLQAHTMNSQMLHEQAIKERLFRVAAVLYISIHASAQHPVSSRTLYKGLMNNRVDGP